MTGSRKWGDRQLMRRVFDRVQVTAGETTLVHGDCGGADLMAAGIAHQKGWAVEPHPAEGHGSWPSCGPKRNSHMVKLGADLCIGFPLVGSKGTWDCIDKAIAKGISTTVVLADWIVHCDKPGDKECPWYAYRYYCAYTPSMSNHSGYKRHSVYRTLDDARFSIGWLGYEDDMDRDAFLERCM